MMIWNMILYMYTDMVVAYSTLNCRQFIFNYNITNMKLGWLVGRSFVGRLYSDLLIIILYFNDYYICALAYYAIISTALLRCFTFNSQFIQHLCHSTSSLNLPTAHPSPVTIPLLIPVNSIVHLQYVNTPVIVTCMPLWSPIKILHIALICFESKLANVITHYYFHSTQQHFNSTHTLHHSLPPLPPLTLIATPIIKQMHVPCHVSFDDVVACRSFPFPFQFRVIIHSQLFPVIVDDPLIVTF
jgi:hypothetical protein